MRKALAAGLLALVLGGAASAGEEPPRDAPARHAVPGGRAGIGIPDELWEGVLRALDRPGRPLGYTAEEMANYSGRKHLLRTVETLFRDARTLPRFSGALAEGLVKNAPQPAEVVRIGYGLTDAVAGRMLPLPDLKEGWGVEGVAKDATPEQALEGVLAASAGGREAFALLPGEVRRLVVRILFAAEEGSAWVGKAFEGVALPEAKERYAFAIAPLNDDRMGQMASLRKGAFDALDGVDREYLAFGSTLLLARVTQALDEYRAAEKHPVPAEFPGLSLKTPLGLLRVYGPGDDAIGESAAVSLDLGGNDRWTGHQGASMWGGRFVSLAVDLAGDDAWDGGDGPASLACGLFGVGAVLDLAGNDTYRAKESGLGCGWFGTGLLFDAAGNDAYEVATHWGMGCGYAGVGALVDLAGDDRYVIGFDGQGYGATLGAGLLLDGSGNDTYLARDDGNISELYLGQSVSMAQGVGQGRRADLGDGHSLAGGFGVLVDGAGDDSYHATCWSHGAGYWWAVGILEDLGGNDTYRDGKYSLGAGAHFAIGVCVDATGDDAYNVGYAEAKNQFSGHGRDGSLGVFFDGDGNDRYHLRSHCAGSGDLGSVGLFFDRRGDDVYEVTASRIGDEPNWGGTPPMGTTTLPEPARSWRDDLDTLGVFLDAGGKDEYRGEAGAWGNDREWPSRRSPRSRGIGRDLEWFERAAPAGAGAR